MAPGALIMRWMVGWMAFEVGGGSCWMRIILMMGFGIGGVRCISYTRDMSLLCKNLLKRAALTVGMCCCMKLEDDYEWGGQ